MFKLIRNFHFFLVITILCSRSIFAQDQTSPKSFNYERLKSQYEKMINNPYILMPYKGNYFLPVSYNDNPNHEVFEKIEDGLEYEDRGKFTKHLESEFQISFMALTNKNIFGTKFNTFLGYTHRSYWQMYNEEWSRPFRETNYNPEAFARYIFDEPVNILGFKLIAYDIGLEHESNGQVQEISRSWNRVYGRMALLTGTTFINFKVWHRLAESAEMDENPNMYRYRGYGQLDIKTYINSNMVQLILIPGTEHFGGELVYSTHWKNGVSFYSKASYGYGISLQDYDHDSRRIGFGVSLGEFFALSKGVN